MWRIALRRRQAATRSLCDRCAGSGKGRLAESNGRPTRCPGSSSQPARNARNWKVPERGRYGRGRVEIERLASTAREEMARSADETRRVNESRDCRHAYARGRSDEYMEIVDAVTETLEECRAARQLPSSAPSWIAIGMVSRPKRLRSCCHECDRAHARVAGCLGGPATKHPTVCLKSWKSESGGPSRACWPRPPRGG